MKSFWKGHFLTFLLVAVDVVTFCLIWRLSWEARRALTGRTFSVPINPWENYAAALPKMLVVWVGLMAFFEHYHHRGRISSLNQIPNIVKAGLGLVVGSIAVAFLFKRYDLGRSVILLSSAGMTAYLYASRTTLRMVKEAFIARGHGLTRAVIIGAGPIGRAVASRIRHHPEVGYELVGFVDSDAALKGRSVEGARVLGLPSELVDLLLRHRVEEVFLAAPDMEANEKFNLITECEQARAHFNVVTNDLFQVISSQVKIDEIGDFAVIPLRQGRLTPFDALLKRLLDLGVAVPLAASTAPLMVVIAWLIRRDSPGPAIFIQERIGKDGRRFRMWKFRTMYIETPPYVPAPNDPSDPRITRVGRFLRQTSLDELPQLLNVIRGEMSLVGPRPEMPFIVDRYEPWQRRRLDVPQGITGLWQIAGRKRLPLHQNLEYDFYYIRNWSLLLDLTILLRTLPAVIFRSGAF